MKILIIGGAGFLGAHVVRRCLRDPENEVTVLDSLEPELHATTAHLQPVWERITFIRGSMGDEPLVADAVQGQDVIINLAAQTSHPRSLQNPLLDAEINCLGNLKFLEAVRLLNRKAVVVYASSSTVIGRAVGDLVDEDHVERPLDIYSANKGVAEKYYRIYNRVHDLKTIVLRFANLYGPYGKGSPEFGFVNYFIDLALRDEEIRIFGSGEQTRNVLHAEDAADALFLAAQSPELIGEVYFATHDEHLSVAQIAEEITREFSRGKITYVPWPDERRRIEIDHVTFSSTRLRDLINWQPAYTFKQGLARTRAVISTEINDLEPLAFTSATN
ncbi:MAG TPA: NAD-dependent epimerase/dehydratase family protein [Pyrinomonadaceae bacterium]|nr:NAD-dependent epimerase/dehydratase family protein [Pyrinomonadaceae bacterium]